MVENSSNATYYGIKDGKIVRAFKEEVPGLTKSRVNKNNRTVHEAFYDRIKGRITDIKVRDREEFGKEWNITLVDSAGNTEVLQFKFSSGYANGFLRALPNVDVTREITFGPFMKMEGDKKKTTLFLNQDGKAAKWAFTKDSPNGCPEMVQVKYQGKLVWDDSEQMEFLEKMVNEQIIPKLVRSGAPIAAGAMSYDGDEDAGYEPSGAGQPAGQEADPNLPF